MKRKIEEHLLKWKNDTNKRPLMIYGNKQVGKTYSVLKFGEEYYKNTVYFNTDNNIELYKIFKRERTIDRIISHLSVLSGESILEGDTLIVFDNLTDPDIASGIKVFGRNKHNYHIILISSLKENIKKFKCEEFQYRMMMSLDFEEYLTAIDNAQLIDFIKSSFRNNKPMPFHSLALEYFDDFLMTGGMPEAVELSIKQRNKLLLNSVYDKIIDAYKKEISTLDNLIDITRSIEVLDSVPFQLQKPNKKFQYGLIKDGGRSKEYETALNFLHNNGFIYKCYKLKDVKSPLYTFKDKDSFKVYMNDTGLLFKKMYLNKNKLDAKYKAILYENSVAIALINIGFSLQYYQSMGKAELDFVIQTRTGSIIPIELVPMNKTKSKSLALFIEKYKPVCAFRITGDNFCVKKNVRYIPVYATFCLSEII